MSIWAFICFVTSSQYKYEYLGFHCFVLHNYVFSIHRVIQVSYVKQQHGINNKKCCLETRQKQRIVCMVLKIYSKTMYFSEHVGHQYSMCNHMACNQSIINAETKREGHNELVHVHRLCALVHCLSQTRWTLAQVACKSSNTYKTKE